MQLRALLSLALLSGCGSGGAAGDAGSVDPDAEVVEPGSYEDPFVKRSRFNSSTFIESQEVRIREDGLMVFCTGVRGMQVVDGADPTDLKPIGMASSARGDAQYPRCQHTAMDGDVVFYSNRGDEIQPTPFVAAFDISGGAPVEIASFVRPGSSFEGIAAAGGFLYVAMHADGLAVLERVGDRFVERGVATGLTNAWGVMAVGNTVYVADGPGGLAIVDVGDPATPSVIGKVELSGSAQSIDVEGTVAYVAASSAGLYTIDVSEPTAPFVLAQRDTPGSALQVSVSNGHAFVAAWNDVRVFDVGDPQTPRLIATETVESSDAFSRVLGIAARNDVAYIGEWTGMYAYQLLPDNSAPDLAVALPTVEFGQTSPGTSDAVALILTNEGTEPLVGFNIRTEGGAFSVDTQNFTLAPGASSVIEVTYRATTTSEESGTLTIESDDPDQEVERIPLLGNRSGLGVGDVGPDITIDTLAGPRWSMADHRGKVVVIAYFATF